ncbi:MAG: CDP-alcohol phosphatidyltransferase family protein [Phycisphaerales bacterium]|nr:CDP-alcohol phosphatidyltransferase family protein [Phycisphaerales bacterium]
MNLSQKETPINSPLNWRVVLPNLFTMMNLAMGVGAIIVSLEHSLTYYTYVDNQVVFTLPPAIVWSSIFIFLASIFDFVDGFVARLTKGASEIGVQLDSLADMVSFGVAPTVIIYQFLELALAHFPDGLSMSKLYVIPSFLITIAACYRLARFNTLKEPLPYSLGVPVTIIGPLVASIPLAFWTTTSLWQIKIIQNMWFWYALIIVLSWAMVSKRPALTLKFKKIPKGTILFLSLVVIAFPILFYFIGWLAITVILLFYVLCSSFFVAKVN